MEPNEIPGTPEELPSVPPMESPPFTEPAPEYPDTPEPEPVDAPD